MIIHHIFLSAAEETAQGGVLGTLGVNWKLFLAQLVNFGIVLLVFWKWVVKPLGETLTRRQEKIESGLKNSEYIEKEKAHFEQWRMNEMRKTRDEADKILQSALVSSEKVKTEAMVAAQHQASKLVEQTKATLQQEKESMLLEAKQDIATLVVAASEKILHAKLDQKKDQELISDTVKSIK